MKCRSCGHVNEERNKFCGSCGAALHEERRRAERRIIAWEPQQCRTCGSMNSAANRFCGMCGTALESERRQVDRRAAADAAPSADLLRKAEPARVERIRVSESAEGLEDSKGEATSYLGAPSPSSSKPRSEWVRSSGSSFLGLEDEAPANSDYLLADEEPESGGGGRVLIALLILAAVGYLIFKNWDSPTFAAALSQLHKHSQDASSNAESKPQPSSAEQPSISTDEAPASADTTKQAAPTDTNKQPATEPPSAATTPDSTPKTTTDNSTSKNVAPDKTPASDDRDTDTAAESAPPPPRPPAKSS